MTQIRAWQVTEPVPDGGHRIIHFVEMDLACNGNGQKLDIRYVPFTAHDPIRIMSNHGAWWSQFGAQAPQYRSVLIIRQGAGPFHFAARYPGFQLPQHENATIVSADAAEVALLMQAIRAGHMRIEQKQLVLAPDQAHIHNRELLTEILNCLWREGRLLYYPSGKTDFRAKRSAPPTIDLIAPLSNSAGYLSAEAHKHHALAAFNAGFFISTEEEFDDPYTFAIAPVGLVIVAGRVVSPPLFRRSALLFTRRVYQRQEDNAVYALGSVRPVIRRVSLANYAVQLPGGVIVHGLDFPPARLSLHFTTPMGDRLVAALNPSPSAVAAAAFYNRLLGLQQTGKTMVYTPQNKERIEFIISGEHVQAVKEGGSTYIPRNGFVISLAKGPLAERVATEVVEHQHTKLVQAIDLGVDSVCPEFGVQVGLPLIHNGQPVQYTELNGLDNEEYVQQHPSQGEFGIPPVHLPPQHMFVKNRARIGIGVRRDNRCYVIQIEGCEPRTFFPEYDSAGGSTADLTRYFLELGCSDAVALDEGGSAQITFRGQNIVRVADRNDVPLSPAERLIPGAWMVFG